MWPRGVPLMPQGSGDLGTRMQRIFDCAPPGPAVIIGTDVPRSTAATSPTPFVCSAAMTR